MTAAKERVYIKRDVLVSAVSRTRHVKPDKSVSTYRCVPPGSDLFSESHQENLWPCVGPVILQVLLSLGASIVVLGLQSLQELGQLGMDIRRQHRHVDGNVVNTESGWERVGGIDSAAESGTVGARSRAQDLAVTNSTYEWRQLF